MDRLKSTEKIICDICNTENGIDKYQCLGCDEPLQKKHPVKQTRENVTQNETKYDDLRCATAENSRNKLQLPVNLTKQTVIQTERKYDHLRHTTAEKARAVKPEKPRWTCDKCSYINENEMDNCNACMTSKVVMNVNKTNIVNKTDHVDDEDISNDKWICSGCKHHNEYDNLACINCETVAPFFDKWRCETCTCINEKLDIMCKACGSKNDNIIYCRRCHNNKINKSFDDICEHCLDAIGEEDKLKNDATGLNGEPSKKNYKKKKLGNKVLVCQKCKKNRVFGGKKLCDKCFNETKDKTIAINQWDCEKCKHKNKKMEPKCKGCSNINNNIRDCRRCYGNKINILCEEICEECVVRVKEEEDCVFCKSCNKNRVYHNRTLCGPCYQKRSPKPDRNKSIERPNKRKCKKCLKTKPPKNKIYCDNCCWSCNKPKCNAKTYPDRGYCYSCGLKQGEDVKHYKLVEVSTKYGMMKMWYCSECNEFNADETQCSRCGKVRYYRGFL